ncbi:MAG: substrate-binding domain-containing protein, partial [Geitlerinemataceae cyanobacterium]
MLRNILKKPTFAAFKLALGVVLTTTSTIGSLPTADRSWAQSSPSATPSSELEPPQDTPSMTKLRVDGSSSMAMVNKTLKQRYEKQFPGANVELKAEGTDLALQDVRNGEIEVAAIGRPLTAEEKANDLQEKRLNREKIAIIVRVDNPYRGNMTYQEFAKIFRGEITDWSEVGGSPGSIRLVDRPENSDTRQAFRGYSIFQEQEFATGATAEQIVADSTDETIEKLGKDGIGYAIASQVMDRDDVWVVPMHQTLPDDPRYPFSQPRTYIYKGAASPATAAFLGLAGVVGQESIAGAATVPPTGGDSPIAASIPPTTGAAIPGEAPTITTSPIAAVPPNPGSPAPTAGSPVAVPPPQPKPPSSTETPAIVAAQPKTAQAPEATPSPMETASLPPSAGTDIPGLIGNNSILPDFWWMLPIGLVALLVWWGVRKLRSQQTSQLPPGDGSTPPVAPSNTAALPPSSAPDVSTLPSGEALTPADLWDTPATPPAAETNPPTVGLAGGAIAGGLAASAISSREPDEPTTPPEAEPSTTADTAIASSGAHTAATSSTIENANLEGSGERPSTAMPPQATEAPTTTDANVATAATAALAGGLAASDMVGGVGDDELASQTSVPSLEPETEAQTAIPASSSQLEETTAE